MGSTGVVNWERKLNLLGREAAVEVKKKERKVEDKNMIGGASTPKRNLNNRIEQKNKNRNTEGARKCKTR